MATHCSPEQPGFAKLAALARNRLLLAVPRHRLASVGEAFVEGVAEPGTALITEGDQNAVLYLLVEGIVELRRGGRHHGFVHADDYFGEEGERERPAAVSAIALTRVRFLCAWHGHCEELRERGLVADCRERSHLPGTGRIGAS